MVTVKVIFTDNDYLITKISCLNTGTVTDELKTIKALEFIY